jgi:hypothetical protein
MNRKERRARGNEPSPYGYGEQARNLFADYIAKGTPCDACGEPTNGDSRTITAVMPDGNRASVIMRTCRRHTGCDINELMPLLPALQKVMGGDSAYIRHDTHAGMGGAR